MFSIGLLHIVIIKHFVPAIEMPWSVPSAHSPIQTTQDGGHAHEHVGHGQHVGSVLAGKLLELEAAAALGQEQLLCGWEKT